MMRPGRRWPFVYAAALLVTAAIAYLSFELGRYQAGYSLLDQRREQARHERRVNDLATEADDLRARLAVLETSREIDRETYAQIEANLGALEARIQAQEEELAFYRGIVSPQDGVAGLRVQSLELLPADAERRYTLELVLVQAIVHSREVAGVVRLRMEGLLDGAEVSFDLEQLTAGNEGGGAVADLEYEFRYFQALEAELSLPSGFDPRQVVVEIRPTEPRGDATTREFPWSAVTG